MQCCANCFFSETLKGHINEEGSQGDCDFCSSENVKCVPVSDLYQYFEPIFAMYREIRYGIDFIKGDDPSKHGELLPQLIIDDWPDIFTDDFDPDMLDDFWASLVETYWIDKDNPQVALTDLYVKTEGGFADSWDSFTDYIRTKRRFTIQDEGLKHFIEFLPEVLSGKEIRVSKDQNYYRARMGTGEEFKPFRREEMGAPPPEKTLTGGRANPPGIPFLYLSDDPQTAIAEVKPWKGATVTVAPFKTIKEFRLVDLTGKVYVEDPFAHGEDLQFAVQDNELLFRLGKELSKPVNPDKISLEYIPTQYLTELIRNYGYHGMIYPSSLGKGKNIVLFEEDVVEALDTKLHLVDSVTYTSSEYYPWMSFGDLEI